MLIRFTVKNLFSFKEETEFNLLPGRVKRLTHHKYQRNGIEILKLSGVYGANGSGKSNLIRSLSILKELIYSGGIPNHLYSKKFKLSKSTALEPSELAIEFFINNSIYYYSISVDNGIVLNEYFSSNDENQEDQVIFHRKYDGHNTSISFFPEFEDVPENQVLKKIIENDLLKPHQPLFTLLSNISNNAFIDIKAAFHWITRRLVILYPYTKPSSLAHLMDVKQGFKQFANELMSSFNTGIAELKIEKIGIEQYLGEDNLFELDEIKSEVKNNPEKVILRKIQKENDEVVIVNHNGEVVAKRLFFEHKGERDEAIEFKINEESDGTRRLLEYLPAWSDVINMDVTYVIDEIERSIHPLIIKELIDKFSKDETTKGQLIFTTHESTLLDQEILRTDEIWFTEKSISGATKLYSLSDFKEHNTIDIRKGYLNGRYGAIPFLGNLQDLNWHNSQDETK